MSKLSKSLSTLIIILICVCFIYIVKAFLNSKKGHKAESISLGRVKGNPQAALRVTEYIDFQCPACAEGSRVLRENFKNYPNKIYLELKYFPLSSHKHGFISARYAECAGRQGKFWPFHDFLIDRQPQWSTLEDAKPAFQQMAKELNLDARKLDACVQDQNVEKIILVDKDKGTSLGIQRTPTYFINGNMVVGVKSLKEELTTHLSPQSN